MFWATMWIVLEEEGLNIHISSKCLLLYFIYAKRLWTQLCPSLKIRDKKWNTDNWDMVQEYLLAHRPCEQWPGLIIVCFCFPQMMLLLDEQDHPPCKVWSLGVWRCRYWHFPVVKSRANVSEKWFTTKKTWKFDTSQHLERSSPKHTHLVAACTFLKPLYTARLSKSQSRSLFKVRSPLAYYDNFRGIFLLLSNWIEIEILVFRVLVLIHRNVACQPIVAILEDDCEPRIWELKG